MSTRTSLLLAGALGALTLSALPTPVGAQDAPAAQAENPPPPSRPSAAPT